MVILKYKNYKLMKHWMLNQNNQNLHNVRFAYTLTFLC